MKMKKAVALFLVLMLTVCMCGTAMASRLDDIKEKGVLVVATSPDWPPYEYVAEDGSYVGSDIDLAKYVAEQLGVELQIDAMEFDAVLAALANGKCDLAVAGLTCKEERLEVMDFSDVYYDDGDQVLLILAENAEELNSLAAFAGKTVAAQNGTMQFDLVAEQLPDTTEEPIANIPTAVLMLKEGKVDGVAVSSVVAKSYVEMMPELTICDEIFDHPAEGVLMGVVKGETELLDAVNEIIATVNEQGLYEQWVAAQGQAE